MKLSQRRIRRGIDLSSRARDRFHVELHVRLSATRPDLAHDHVADDLGVAVRGADLHLPRFGAGGEGIELQRPFAIRIRRRGLALSGEFDGDLCSWLRPAPNGHRLIALEHHVVGKDRGQAEIACRFFTQETDHEWLHGPRPDFVTLFREMQEIRSDQTRNQGAIGLQKLAPQVEPMNSLFVGEHAELWIQRRDALPPVVFR